MFCVPLFLIGITAYYPLLNNATIFLSNAQNDKIVFNSFFVVPCIIRSNKHENGVIRPTTERENYADGTQHASTNIVFALSFIAHFK